MEQSSPLLSTYKIYHLITLIFANFSQIPFLSNFFLTLLLLFHFFLCHNFANNFHYQWKPDDVSPGECRHKQTRTWKGMEGCRGAEDKPKKALLKYRSYMLMENSLQINKLLSQFLSKLKE